MGTKNDSGNEIKIFKLLKKKLKLSVGNFISSKQLKLYFNEIYEVLKLNKTGKGTDIFTYYEVKETVRKIENKSLKGYIIIRPKIVYSS